ncbi:DUF747-domain-containing protein [Aureobasidium sp. EXF-3400]|nr:DUF747-domain-containing protein [Aureobasidium sp. EXF-12344]KAI4767819.1 DUF747-domain-containing protein [Aureobasidium sp. EXF-3400]
MAGPFECVQQDNAIHRLAMKESTPDSSEANGIATQEQLPTPALSPITEHGTNSYTADLDSTSPGLDGLSERSTSPAITPTTVVARLLETNASNGKLLSPSPTLKLSAAQMQDLISSPESLPLRAVKNPIEEIPPLTDEHIAKPNALGISTKELVSVPETTNLPTQNGRPPPTVSRPTAGGRSNSTPVIKRKPSSAQIPRNPIENKDTSRTRRPTLNLKGSEYNQGAEALKLSSMSDSLPSPMPATIPVPPLSLPTYLQLELSSERPSALYIHRSASSDFPYESSKAKFERLYNFLALPPQLEQTLVFGALACLDAWLYTFTILPLRFLKAIGILIKWWVQSMIKEFRDISSFIYSGLGRVWHRRTQPPSANPSRRSSLSSPLIDPASAPANTSIPLDGHDDTNSTRFQQMPPKLKIPNPLYRHRRSKSTPSALLPNHKADLLHGALIIISCMILVQFDASRMYHKIRGQAAIKLYVIYNVLEVFDRLLSAIGQDIIECLFSKETLERKPNGRSKILLPLGMFILALAYNVAHAAMLFYQVIALNVAVNSYSNALLTLLMSNQFVEIKGTVFKKFEKENLFQLTCADVVERFQLWLMLLIIALRNIVEVGGLNMSSSSSGSTTTFSPNSTGSPIQSFGQIFGPFVTVIGSEMIVDWVKHAYISKFNNIKPSLYGRFLDVLTKDYYSHAFADQNLTKRLGLPVLPLSCLFIRASVQTYHMFIATHMPLPMPSTATSIALESASGETSPSTTAALAHIDQIFRRALGRSSFGAGADAVTGASSWSFWTIDDAIALGTMLVFFLIIYLILLAFKLLLGMLLLSFSRTRYRKMKMQEHKKQNFDTQGRRVGGWGAVEVDEDKRRWIYEDDPEGLKNLRDREAKGKEKAKGELKLDGVDRYMMAAKRIW